MKLPKELEQAIAEQSRDLAHKGKPSRPTLKKLEHHIDCFPWRRKLFEHFGIRHQEISDKVRYYPFHIASSDNYGFSDLHYNRFPYTEIDEDKPTVGRTIYDWLRKNYNIESTSPFQSHKKSPAPCNTVMLYTMGEFLYEDDAGRCIINFYKNITKPMLDGYCFCGDRVAVLGQPNQIWDDPKDSPTGREHLYSVSDLIRVGMDQATYMSERKRIKTSDYLRPPIPADDEINETTDAVENRVKSHIRNRSIPLNPDNPVYVTQYKEGIQKGLHKLFKETVDLSREPKFRCLYHIMLDTLRYTNEIAVDLSSNSIQAMFWLGAAHGSDVYAVTVRHEMSEKEKPWSGKDAIAHDRPIFDIGGLWTAMLRYGEMDSFNTHLELIQQGIDQHARLKLPEPELETYEYEVFRQLYHSSPYPFIRNTEEHNTRITKIETRLMEKSRTESLALESYYRERFWRQLLRDNQLHLFLPLNDADGEQGPRLQVIKWDMDTVAELSHYLSKRKVIGKYQFDTLRENQYYGKDASKENFISIGEQTHPLTPDDRKSTGLTLADWINKQPLDGKERAKKMVRFTMHKGTDPEKYPVQRRGFQSKSKTNSVTHARQFFPSECTNCLNRDCEDNEISKDILAYKACKNKVSHDGSLPQISPRFFVKGGNIHSYFHCIGPNPPKSNNDHNILRSLVGNAIVLKKPTSGKNKKENAYAVEIGDAFAGMSLESVVSLLNLCDPRVQNEDLGKNRITLKFPDDTQEAHSPCNASSRSVTSTMYAQLLLWREEQKKALPADANTEDPQNSTAQSKERTEYKYHVSLVGVSGPATKALTALLVDEEQKGGIWGVNPDELGDDVQKQLCRYLPLNTLQTHIREDFYDKFASRIPNDRDAKIALQLSLSYLSTILPQYFLPFLSQSDEKRIYHGLEAFLRTTDSQNDPIFEDAVNQYTDTILSKLENVLSGFRGVDALYQVKVSAKPSNDQAGGSDKNTDNRSIRTIKLLEDDKKKGPVITCLYVDPNAN